MPDPRQDQQQKPDFQDYALSTFGGLDTSSDPTAVKDEDFPWLFDYIPVDNGYLPVVPGPTKVTSGLGAVYWIDYANLGGVDYAIYMDTTGTLSAINIGTGAISTIGNGFSASQSQTMMWSNTNLLIIDMNLGYKQWNGSALTLIDGTAKGYTLETHAGRVWRGNGRTVTFSAPGSFTDFTTPNGGGSFTMNDDTLQGGIIALMERESILYILGATSVNAIGDLTVPSGSSTPVFSNNNLQASIGTPYLRGTGDLQRIIFLVGPSGVYGLYGVNAPKLSDPLNGIINLLATINGQFHGAVGNVLNHLVFAFLGTLTHPNYTGPVLACYLADKRKWFLAEQGANLNAVCAAEIGGVQTIIGADNAGNVYKLFTNNNAVMHARVDTKLFGFESPIYDHEVIRAGLLVEWQTADTAGLSVISDATKQTQSVGAMNSISFTGSDGNPLIFLGSDSNPLSFFSFGAALIKSAFSIRGKHVGLSFTQTSPKNWVRAFLMRVRRATPW